MTRITKEPLLRIATSTHPANMMSPADIMLQPLIRTYARSTNQSLVAFWQSISGLSRSQLHEGVYREATLRKAEAYAHSRFISKTGLSEEAASKFLNQIPGVSERSGWKDFVHFAFLGIGDPSGAMDIATRIDNLIYALEEAFQNSFPTSEISTLVKASGLFSNGMLNGTEQPLLADFSEAKALADCEGGRTSWQDARPLLAVLLQHLLLILLAAIDLRFAALCLSKVESKLEFSLYRLFPAASARLGKMPRVRRNAVEKPVARLIDMTARIIHFCRYGSWPRRKVSIKRLIAWSGCISPPIAKWRSGEQPLTSQKYQEFFARAVKRPASAGQQVSAPMILYLVAILLETLYVKWHKPGIPAQVLIISGDRFAWSREHVAGLVDF